MSEPPLSIVVDREACIGSGSCVLEASSTFDLDEENVAVVRDPAGDALEDVLSAMRLCPTSAIEVRRGGELLE